jgi:23S rRNA pseudouridine1911/1915/1917 synthase
MYEDEDLICLNKPAGIVVHPSHGHFSDSLANYLAFHYEQTGDPHEIRTIGRLDKDTSGLIFYGKSRTVCAHMMEQADRGEREKFYLALAEGVFQSETGTIDEPISREFDDQIKRVVREGGDRAVTHYRVVRQYKDYALVRVTIDTGRTHQIRVHMAHIGHPLLGDPLYGRGETGELKRAALHAERVVFRQPFSGEYLELKAPLPDDMKHFLSE